MDSVATVAIDATNCSSRPLATSNATPPDHYLSCFLFRIVLNSGIIGAVCVLGLIGNFVSMLVLRLDRQNHVASFLLQALAVVDNAMLLVSVLVLSVLYGQARTTLEVDRLIVKYVNPCGYVTQGATIWMTVLLAINRYVAVCRPLKAGLMTMRCAKIQVAVVILLSIAFNIPRIYLHKHREGTRLAPPTVHNLVPNQSELQTAATWRMDVAAANNASDTFGSKEIFMTFELVYTMVVLILPLILLVGLNVRLIQELQGAKHRLRSYSKEYSGVNEDNITIVMVVIVLTLVFCHTPDRILQIVRWMLVKSPLDCPNPFFYAVNISNFLIVLNSSVNFIIYYVFRKRFRRILQLKACAWVRGTRRTRLREFDSNSSYLDRRYVSLNKPIEASRQAGFAVSDGAALNRYGSEKTEQKRSRVTIKMADIHGSRNSF